MVVCDYNYYLDMGWALCSTALPNSTNGEYPCWSTKPTARSRARGMYTAELNQEELHELCRIAPSGLRGLLQRVSRHWELNRVQQADYKIHPVVLDLLVAVPRCTVSAITNHPTDYTSSQDRLLLQFYLNAMLFCRLSEAYGPHSLLDVTGQETQAISDHTKLSLCNIVHGLILASRFSDAHTTTLLSATLRPARYYQDLLGLPEETQRIDGDLPFSAG